MAEAFALLVTGLHFFPDVDAASNTLVYPAFLADKLHMFPYQRMSIV